MILLRSDEVRKELAGINAGERAGAPYREGIYGPEHTVRTYDALLQRASTALGLGESVVIDASWTDQRWRDRKSTRLNSSHSCANGMQASAWKKKDHIIQISITHT